MPLLNVFKRSADIKGNVRNTAATNEKTSFDATAIPQGTFDPVYEAKAKTLNQAIQEIGMGRYQWELFVVIGFGWASDNFWPIITSLILTAVSNEFRPNNPPLLTLAQNIGLLVGAVFWGFGSDIFGRRWAFNLTLGITGIFGIISASSPNFASICIFAALWSLGVGGNLPVDSAIFLEFLPRSHQYLLTVLSFYWAFAQLVANLIAWPLLSNFTCQQDDQCTRQGNLGWRYFLITTGGIAILMFSLRFFFFTIYESPKFLMGKGQDSRAVEVVHAVARRNGKTSNLTLHDLQQQNTESFVDKTDENGPTALSVLSRSLQDVKFTHIRSLFSSPKLAFSTSLITTIWALIGLAFPLYNAFLPYIQATRGADLHDGSTYITYRNSLIIAVVGIPGCLLGGILVDLPRLGRKGTLAMSACSTGAFLFASTTASTSDALLGWNCAFNFTTSLMYAVLYSYTPEIFATKDRGTGNAITAAANRIFGIMAPIIAIFANINTAAPVYVSGSLFIVAGLLVLFLPYESRGTASL